MPMHDGVRSRKIEELGTLEHPDVKPFHFAVTPIIVHFAYYYNPSAMVQGGTSSSISALLLLL